MSTLCSDVEGACFKVVKRAWTKSLCSLEVFFLDLFSNFFLEECSSLIPFCFPLFIMLKVMMTIRDAYLLSGSQWGDILFKGKFLFLNVKLIKFINCAFILMRFMKTEKLFTVSTIIYIRSCMVLFPRSIFMAAH